jgi:hypothetical protein
VRLFDSIVLAIPTAIAASVLFTESEGQRTVKKLISRRNSMKTKILLVIALGSFCLVAPAKGGLIYDNGGVPGDRGVTLAFAFQVQPIDIVADDFHLDQDAVLTAVTVRTVRSADGSFVLREVRYVIFADNNGAPGSILTSGTGAITRNEPTGLRFGSGELLNLQWEIDFSLETPLLLEGGQTFWLGLEAIVDPITVHPLWWEQVGPGDSVSASFLEDPMEWRNSNEDLAFSLYGELLPPCDGPWKNHGQYVSSVAAAGERLAANGLITTADRNRLIQTAAKSDCGKK